MQRNRPGRGHDLIQDTRDLIKRASRAYRKRFGEGSFQPSSHGSDVEGIGGKQYVVLRNVNGVLAVYAIGAFGSLHYVEKQDYPKKLANAA